MRCLFSFFRGSFHGFFQWLGLLLLLGACATPPTTPIRVIPPSSTPSEMTPPPSRGEEKPELPRVETESIPPPQIEPKRSHYQIAILLPLSGPDATLGRSILRGAEMALYRYAKPGFTLNIYDTQGHRLRTTQVTRQALSEGADLILGPVFSRTSEVVIPLAQQAGVPVMSFSNNPSLLTSNESGASSPIYILGVTPGNQLQQLIEAGSLWGVRRFALIAPDDIYGQQIHQDMRVLLSESPATFTRVAYYNPEEIDFSNIIQRLSDYRERRIAYKNAAQRLRDQGLTNPGEIEKSLGFKETYGSLPFDALLIITYDSNRLRTMAAQLEYYEVDPETVKFMGLQQWQDFPHLYNEPSLRSSWFVGFDPRRFNEFQRLYRELYNEAASVFAALGFDSLALLAHFSQKSADPLALIVKQHQEILGAAGAFRFENDGRVTRTMSLFEVADGEIIMRFEAEKN